MRNHTQFVEVNLRPPKRGQPMPLDLAARLPNFIGGPADAATRLRAHAIFIVGVGSVGGRIGVHLARLGVAMLWLIDPKRNKPEGVLTHDLEPHDAGKYKAMTTGRRCKAINPATRVFAFTGSAEAMPLDALAETDLVVLASDNLAAEIEVGQRCVRLGKPLVQASVHGDTLTAQVRAFGNADGQGPCPACGFGAVEWRMLNEQVRFTCDGSGSPRPGLHQANPPTMSVSSLCSLAADLAVNQILRIALPLGEPVLDTNVEFSGFTNRGVTTRLARNANCPMAHGQCKVVNAEGRLSQSTLGELSKVVACTVDSGPVSFAVDGFGWIESGACRCATPKAMRRFVPTGRERVGHCSKCRSPILAQPIFTHRVVAARLLGDALERPLEELGAASARCVLVSNGDQSVLFREPNAALLA